MEEIEITIPNWKKYNPNSDRIRNPHWFRVHRDMAMSDSLSSLSAGQCWVWIQILSECSRKNSATVRLKIQKIAFLSRVTKEEVLEVIEILSVDGGLCKSVQSTAKSVQSTAKSVQSTAPREEKKREEKTTTTAEIESEESIPLKTKEMWERRYGAAWLSDALALFEVEFGCSGSGSSFDVSVSKLPKIVRLNRYLDAKHKKDLKKDPKAVKYELTEEQKKGLGIYDE
jgi:hypothetical protein